MQVFSGISEGSTPGKHDRFPRAYFPEKPYIPSAGNFLRAICQACLVWDTYMLSECDFLANQNMRKIRALVCDFLTVSDILDICGFVWARSQIK